jgi:DNA (cytosine-5)-methyltransferase 1
MFDAWLKAMHLLGYMHKCVYLNSQFCYPTPQSRDRMYVVFWKKGNKAPNLNFTPAAYCRNCEKDILSIQAWKNPAIKFGKYNKQYVYRCPTCTAIVEPYYYSAFNIIDWSIPGKSVLDRKKPLSANTIRRIEYGLKKYGNEPLIITTKYTSGIASRVRSTLNDVLPTQPGETSHYLLNPFFINTSHSKGKDNCRVKCSADPLATQTTADTIGVVLPGMPLIVENNGQSKSRPAVDRIGCMTTTVKHGIAIPDSISAFLSYYYSGSDQVSSINSAAGTVSTKDRLALINTSIAQPTLENCTYRTIKPHEVKAAMAFDKDYIVLGDSKDKVRQLGNAVTPPAMEWLVERCIESLM